MPCLGRIEALSASAGIDRRVWVALIGTHPALKRVPPREGINPFTREKTEFKAPQTSAVISIRGMDIGSIYWAMDDSPMLIVHANDGSAESVAAVAEEVAAALSARFVPETEC